MVGGAGIIQRSLSWVRHGGRSRRTRRSYRFTQEAEIGSLCSPWLFLLAYSMTLDQRMVLPIFRLGLLTSINPV